MAAQTPKKDLKNLQHAQDVPEELEAVKEWWNTHGNIVTIVLVVILVIVLGIRQYRSWRASQTEQQSMALLQAAGPADFETIVQENKSPETVAIARLHLAAAYYADNKFEMAAGVYRDFLKDTPRHAMADTARMGLAHCEEALGNIDAALAAYDAFLTANPASFLAADATISKARCLFLKGTPESVREGKAMLDLFLTENAGTAWAELADETLRARDRLKVSVPASSVMNIEDFLKSATTPAMEVPAAPAADAPAAEAPAAEPAAEAPAAEAPAEPAAEAPAAEPAAEPPAAEPPAAEAPAAEVPAAEAPAAEAAAEPAA